MFFFIEFFSAESAASALMVAPIAASTLGMRYGKQTQFADEPMVQISLLQRQMRSIHECCCEGIEYRRGLAKAELQCLRWVAASLRGSHSNSIRDCTV